MTTSPVSAIRSFVRDAEASYRHRDGSDVEIIAHYFPGARIIEAKQIRGSYVHYTVQYGNVRPQTINIKRRTGETKVLVSQAGAVHPSVAIETFAVVGRRRLANGKPGWTIDRDITTIDWVLYTFPPDVSDRGYIFPYRTLRAVSLWNLGRWKKMYRERPTISWDVNLGLYNSRYIPVPANVVQDAVAQFDPLNAPLLV